MHFRIKTSMQGYLRGGVNLPHTCSLYVGQVDRYISCWYMHFSLCICSEVRKSIFMHIIKVPLTPLLSGIPVKRGYLIKSLPKIFKYFRKFSCNSSIFWCFQGYPRFSKIIQDFPRLSKIIQDFPRLSKIFQDYPRWSKTIQDDLRLSMMI